MENSFLKIKIYYKIYYKLKKILFWCTLPLEKKQSLSQNLGFFEENGSGLYWIDLNASFDDANSLFAVLKNCSGWKIKKIIEVLIFKHFSIISIFQNQCTIGS